MQSLEKELNLKIPGVLITADVSEDVIIEAESYGYSYLSKPVKPAMLRKTLQKLTNTNL